MTTTPPPSAAPLNVGMIGYGFMGAAHSHAWRTAHRFVELPLTPRLHTLAGRTESAVTEAAERFGFAAHTTRWQDVVEDPAIDVVDICTPGDTHYEIAMAALDRKSTRLNSSHVAISYAVFCLEKKTSR